MPTHLIAYDAYIVKEAVEETITIKYEESLTVEEKIEYYANIYELDVDTMKSIAWHESRYKNVWNYRYEENPNYYTAFGIFQIVRSTYASFCGDPQERFNEDKNIECAMKIASTGGLHHWDESKHMWK